MGAGREPPFGDDEAVILDLLRRHGERSGISGRFGHGEILPRLRYDRIAHYPGMKKPRAETGARLTYSVD
jgi:hypothetical protein